MKIYILDDDINVIKVLENIIISENVGNVVGYNTESKVGLEEIKKIQPDIVLVDLLMGELDGINLIEKTKTSVQNDEIKFIMISQVIAKDMVSKAYEAGVEFFINKPINKIEVKNIIEKVSNMIEKEKQFDSIKQILNNEMIKESKNADFNREKLLSILNDIGISGKKGSKEIVKICEMIITQNMRDFSLNELYKYFEKPNVVRQRIRRAVAKGLQNIASLGIEDFMNIKFNRYSNNLYEFYNVKMEMDHLRGKNKNGGKISVKDFIKNLIILIK